MHSDKKTLRPIIVASNTDPASSNIARQLIRQNGFQASSSSPVHYVDPQGISLITVDKECIYVEPADIPIEYSAVVFVSKHRSAEGRPALTTHTTGNLTNEAKYGGNPAEVSWVDPLMIRHALGILRDGVREAAVEIEVTMESTHHGPTSFPVPVCFVELGSGDREWSDASLASLVAKAAASAAATIKPASGLVNVVGFGGTHYPSKITETSLAGKYLVGHHVPKHVFESDSLSKEAIRNTFEKTFGGCETALVDWKGLKGRHRTMLLDWLSEWKIEVVRC